MDREWLTTRLAAGCSIESIAREAGRPGSTVGYWIRKYDLASSHAPRHAARGGLDEAELQALVDRDLTVRQIAAETGRSPTTVRYWLRRFGLSTTTEARRQESRAALRGICPVHGEAQFVATPAGASCGRCRADSVSAWRRRAKQILVGEAGGACAICGYDRCVGALQFHHLDPAQKRFGLGSRGLARAIEVLREEAAKCILLCANCHAEVEAGLTRLPFCGAKTGTRE